MYLYCHSDLFCSHSLLYYYYRSYRTKQRVGCGASASSCTKTLGVKSSPRARNRSFDRYWSDTSATHILGTTLPIGPTLHRGRLFVGFSYSCVVRPDCVSNPSSQSLQVMPSHFALRRTHRHVCVSFLSRSFDQSTSPVRGMNGHKP